MERVLIVLLASVMMLGIMVLPTATFALPSSKLINKRLNRQKEQIHTVDKFYARRNNGHIGPREFIDLNHKLNHSSPHIYRLKHNDWNRW